MARRAASKLLDRDLLFVLGKGGVGRSTVAAALALASAERGRRTILCEVAEQDQLSRTLGREAVPGVETQIGEHLWAISVSPQDALKEWLRKQLGAGPVYRLVAASNAFQYFVAAAPGARELVTIGKIWDLAQLEHWDGRASVHDLVIVDMPASGHGLAMLRTPKTFGDIARVGAIHRQAEKIWTFIRDQRRTAYLAVALPEEMPVNETLEFEAKLEGQLGVELDAVVLNALYPQRFTQAEADRLDAAVDGDGDDPERRGALLAALSEHRRARAQRAQLRRLRRGTDAPVVTLPFVFGPELDREALERLGRELAKKL